MKAGRLTGLQYQAFDVNAVVVEHRRQAGRCVRLRRGCAARRAKNLDRYVSKRSIAHIRNAVGDRTFCESRFAVLYDEIASRAAQDLGF